MILLTIWYGLLLLYIRQVIDLVFSIIYFIFCEILF
jgi:hypothetical protein